MICIFGLYGTQQNLTHSRLKCPHKLHQKIPNSKPTTSRTNPKQSLYRYLKKLENGSKIFTLDLCKYGRRERERERERGALPVGCVGAGPAVWFGGLMSGVVREKERRTGEEEREEMNCVVGKKGSRKGGGDLSNTLQVKLRKSPNNLITKILGVTTVIPSSSNY